MPMKKNKYSDTSLAPATGTRAALLLARHNAVHKTFEWRVAGARIMGREPSPVEPTEQTVSASRRGPRGRVQNERAVLSKPGWNPSPRMPAGTRAEQVGMACVAPSKSKKQKLAEARTYGTQGARGDTGDVSRAATAPVLNGKRRKYIGKNEERQSEAEASAALTGAARASDASTTATPLGLFEQDGDDDVVNDRRRNAKRKERAWNDFNDEKENIHPLQGSLDSLGPNELCPEPMPVHHHNAVAFHLYQPEAHQVTWVGDNQSGDTSSAAVRARVASHPSLPYIDEQQGGFLVAPPLSLRDELTRAVEATDEDDSASTLSYSNDTSSCSEFSVPSSYLECLSSDSAAPLPPFQTFDTTSLVHGRLTPLPPSEQLPPLLPPEFDILDTIAKNGDEIHRLRTTVDPFHPDALWIENQQRELIDQEIFRLQQLQSDWPSNPPFLDL